MQTRMRACISFFISAKGPLLFKGKCKLLKNMTV